MDKKFFPLLWLLITLFFIRALVPAGFMPDVSGKHVLTICSGMSTSTVIVDENNQPVSESTNHHPDQPSLTNSCPFSFLSTALLTDPNLGLPLVTPPPVTAEGMTAFLLSGILPTSLRNNHLSRAPPQLS